MFDRIKEAVEDFRDDPIENLHVLAAFALCAGSAVEALMMFIIFIAGGGFADQIAALKGQGEEFFTAGNVSRMYGQIQMWVVGAVMAVSMVLVVIAFFQRSSKVRRVFMIINLALPMLLIAVMFGFGIALENSNSWSVEAQMTFLKIFTDAQGVQSFFVILGVASAVLVLGLILQLIFSGVRGLLGITALSAVMAYGVFPLLLLILENLIPLAVVGFLVIIIGMIFFVKKGGFQKVHGSDGKDYVVNSDGDRVCDLDALRRKEVILKDEINQTIITDEDELNWRN